MDEEIEKYDFSNGDEFSDFKLIVENKAILIHKAVLGIFNFKILYYIFKILKNLSNRNIFFFGPV